MQSVSALLSVAFDKKTSVNPLLEFQVSKEELTGWYKGKEEKEIGSHVRNRMFVVSCANLKNQHLKT